MFAQGVHDCKSLEGGVPAFDLSLVCDESVTSNTNACVKVPHASVACAFTHCFAPAGSLD
jgi:hypothetical protein